MHRWLGLIANIFAASLIATPAVSASSDQGTPTGGTPPAQEIDRILSEIQIGLVKAQSQAAAHHLPKLASVSLELETEFIYGAGGELRLYVVTLGGSLEKAQMQRLLLTLVPPKPYTEVPVGRSDISENLSAAILAAAQGVANATTRNPPLILRKLDAEIRFVVKTSGEGGAQIELLPITADIKGDVSKSAIQTITVGFDSERQ